MERRTTGTIISARRQWWLKVNRKAFRTGPLDGAAFPYIVKIRYMAAGREYTAVKWIGTGYPVPSEGDTVELVYDSERPEKIKIIY